jgi:hypothetical protein
MEYQNNNIKKWKNVNKVYVLVASSIQKLEAGMIL